MNGVYLHSSRVGPKHRPNENFTTQPDRSCLEVFSGCKNEQSNCSLVCSLLSHFSHANFCEVFNGLCLPAASHANFFATQILNHSHRDFTTRPTLRKHRCH